MKFGLCSSAGSETGENMLTDGLKVTSPNSERAPFTPSIRKLLIFKLEPMALLRVLKSPDSKVKKMSAS